LKTWTRTRNRRPAGSKKYVVSRREREQDFTLLPLKYRGPNLKTNFIETIRERIAFLLPNRLFLNAYILLPELIE
jgi:hypothetical protein